MKAVVCRGPGKVAVEQIDEPSPKTGEVKLKIAAVGVCHTDLNFTTGSMPVPYPIVLGHDDPVAIHAEFEAWADRRQGRLVRVS